MRKRILSEGEQYIEKQRKRRRWRRWTAVLSLAVACWIAYVMILPAITMEHIEEVPVAAETEIPTPEEDSQPKEETETPAPEEDPQPEEETETPTPEEDPQPEEETETPAPEGDPQPEEETETPVPEEVPTVENPVPVGEMPEAEREAEVTEPLNVEDYVSEAKLYYQKPGNEEWIGITEETTGVPGDASFKLDVQFEKVPFKQLKNANGQMTYTIPEIFRDATVNSSITSGGKDVGTMSVSDGTVKLQFSVNWLNDPEKQNETLVNGSFYVIANAALGNIIPGQSDTIKIGGVEIKINFEGDLLAKYGKIDLVKTFKRLIENEDGYFLEYVLNVTAGPDGCPDVTVKDSITCMENGNSALEKYVEGYVTDSFRPTAENVTFDESEKSFTWTIGDMKPEEIRTLTYQVKLNNNYLGGKEIKAPVINIAEVYSGEHKRDSKTAEFTPKAGGTLSKIAGEYIENENGGGTIQYTIWVKALDDNNYTLKNVTIGDALDGTVTGGNKTDEKFLPYLSYDESSFRLYQGGVQDQKGSSGLNEIQNAGPAEIAANKTSFTYNVGDLKPGECKTLVYTVKVSEGIHTVDNGKDISIQNRATIMTPNRNGGGLDRLNSFNREKTISTKKWSRKLLGEKVNEKKPILMGENSFEVPAGSYQYQVVVNETGYWDVSSAVLKDTFQGTHMRYVGYLQIDEYVITDQNGISAGNDDKTAVEKLQTLTPTATRWIKIDGETSFETTPEKAGFNKGKKAYLLTYYAVPIGIENLSQVIVNNQFAISGEVIGNGTYNLTGIQVNASVTVEGENSFQAEKNYWYYEAGTSDESLGTFCWILKIRGNMIPSGTKLQDLIAGDNHTMGTVVKAFTAKTIEDFSIYKDLNALGSMDLFEKYSAEIDNSSLCITLNENVILGEDNSLYFVVSTKPKKLPEKLGDSMTYTNQLLSKDPVEGAEFYQQSEAKNTLTAGGNIYKELGAIFTAEKNAEDRITADNIKFLKEEYKDTKLQLDHLEQSGGGTYVAWKVTVNKESNLSGQYRIKEQIPEGMEVTYIQQYSSPNYGTRPWFKDQGDMEGYTKVEKKYDQKYDQNPITAYYYVKGQEVIWDVDGLKADPSNPGSMYVTFLVVCKLTDKEVLLGGTEKEFTNQVWLQRTDGQELGYGSDSVKLQAQTLSKTGTYDPNTSGGRYPFEIILNENGTDLLQGSDEIKLIDEMCDILILDPSSIEIVNTKTEEKVANFKAQYENNRLTLTIPDDQPLKITYIAAINAKPGDDITITNKAYWYGYTSNGSEVSTPINNYQAGAYVGTDESPSVTIIKHDQYDTGTLLAGAEFSLQEMELSGTVFQEKAGSETLTGTTDSSGKLKFGEGKLQFNTVYRLKETKAPSDYVLLEDPIYLLIAKMVDGVYPGELKQYHDLGVRIHYEGPQYTIDVYNHKGEIKVTKNFADAAGNPLGINLNGTYRFGLFEGDNKEPIQTAEIIFNNGNMTPNDGIARFTNVTLDKTYKIYELDDKGKTIESDAEGIVSGMPFIVTYKNNEVTVSTEKPTAEITVTNRMNYAELPASGGLGSEICTVSGGVLAAGAAGLLGVKVKRRRGRADHTEI